MATTSAPSSLLKKIGVNLRITGYRHRGGRKHMEDVFSVAYQQTEGDEHPEFVFFGVFDGHSGKEAAVFAKENLMNNITRQENFRSDDDELVLKSIREGFLSTQQAIHKELTDKKGRPSNAGTTASICFIKRGKLFIGHCGDSGIALGEQDQQCPKRWKARMLTTDHKPESQPELFRIQQAGGQVVTTESGVTRVVWFCSQIDHLKPKEIPFLAISRSLGDCWSYNADKDVFVVSPDPDLQVLDLDILKHRCLILATDGGWNTFSPDRAVQCVFEVEKNNYLYTMDPEGGPNWINPSEKLVTLAMDRWARHARERRADNVSIITVMLDPPGKPHAHVLRQRQGPSLLQPEMGFSISSLSDGEKHSTKLFEIFESVGQVAGAKIVLDSFQSFVPRNQQRYSVALEHKSKLENEDTSTPCDLIKLQEEDSARLDTGLQGICPGEAASTASRGIKRRRCCYLDSALSKTSRPDAKHSEPCMVQAGVEGDTTTQGISEAESSKGTEAGC